MNSKNNNQNIEKKSSIKFLIDELKKANILKKELKKSLIKENFTFTFISNEVKEISNKKINLIEEKLNKKISKQNNEFKFLKLLSILNLNDDEFIFEIRGFFYLDKNELELKLKKIHELEESDHRKISKKLEIFMIDEKVGKGFPVWLPNGVFLKRQIQKFIFEKEEEYDYLQVETPALGSVDLYKTSGHYYHYKDSMFPEMKIEENETFILRPMACPHHVMIFKSKPRSFRELPIRYAEQVKQYRYEFSGSLLGLERVRAMELTDSHIFLTEEQLKLEIKKIFELIILILKKFNINLEFIELALHDSNNKSKYHGDEKLWEKSEKILKEFLVEEKIKFIEKKGEAAFYGPKIDLQIKTVLGHIITISTIQLDFLLPERFDISYIDSNNQKKRPIMIHRSLIGTYERFISILLEQTKGNLPFWINPNQVVIFPIKNDLHYEYSKKIFKILKRKNIRVKIDDSDDRLSNKIRKYQTNKTKILITIGDEEVKKGFVSIRHYGSEKIEIIKENEIEKFISNQISKK